jgi:hypothetical protein
VIAAGRALRIAGGIGLVVLGAWLAPAVLAAPGETVAARDRDEDLRVERFLPLTAAFAGIVGVVVARRLHEPRLGRAVRLAAPLLTLVLALGPLAMIEPRPLNRQPSPDAQEYADAARHLAAGEGYVVTIRRGESQPPRYPPGFSLALAPFALAGPYPANVQLGSKLFAMLYLVVTLVAAWVVAGPLAAAVAVALVGSSPFGVRYASLVMSDAFAAALSVAALARVYRPSTPRLAGAGLLAGALILVRLSGVLTLAALLAATLTGAGRRLDRRGLLTLAAAGLLGVALLGAQQWWTFGNPLMTGYQYWLPEIRTFGLDYPLDPETRRDGSGIVADSLDGLLSRWACPCPEDDPLFAFRAVTFYPLVLLGLFWIFVPPLATVPGLVEVWRRRHEPGPAYVLWLTILTVLFHLFYFYVAARFVAGPATLLAIYSGAVVARWAERWARRRRAPAEPSLAHRATEPVST